MNANNSAGMALRFRQAIYQKFCPECGSRMKELDRYNEEMATFIWYQCSRDDCDGQWLQKVSGLQLVSGFQFKVV